MRSAKKVFWKSLALFLAFVIGIATGLGVLAGVGFIVYEKVAFGTINGNITHIETENTFNEENAEIKISDLTMKKMVEEYQFLVDIDDGLNLDLLISRYGFVINDGLEKYVTPAVRKVPLNKLFTKEGMDSLLQAMTVADLMEYEKVPNPDYAEGTDEPETIWVKNGQRVTGVNSIFADYNLLQLTNGGIESSDFNDLPLCDVLGFAKGEDGKYYDNGKEVTGIMAVLADTPIKDIQNRVDTSETGELMGYDKAILPVLNENGDQVLDEQGNAVTKTVWYDGVDEAGNPKEIHPIMNRVASSKFDELDKLPDILVLGDIIPEDKRSGLVSFIDPETKIDDIPAAVDTVFNTTPLSDLVDEGVVVFDPLLDGDGNVIKTSEQRAEEFKQKAVSSWTMPQVMEFLFTADPQTPPTP